MATMQPRQTSGNRSSRRAAILRGMSKVLGYFAFLLSGALALWFVAGWVDGIRRDGFSNTVYSMVRWPAVSLTVALPLLAVVFLCVGFSLARDRKPPA
jgi:hypothetical protein